MASGWGPESFMVPGKWQMLKPATKNKAVCHMPWNTKINKLLCSETSNVSLHFHKTKPKLLWIAFEALFPIISLYSLPHTLHSSPTLRLKLPWHYPRVLNLHVSVQEDFLGCPLPLPCLFFFFNASKLTLSFMSQLNVISFMKASPDIPYTTDYSLLCAPVTICAFIQTLSWVQESRPCHFPMLRAWCI